MPKVVAAILVALLSTACANTSAIKEGTAEQVCKSWGEIRPSRKDVLTPDTSRQIAGNNAAHEQWCPSTPQKVAKAG